MDLYYHLLLTLMSCIHLFTIALCLAMHMLRHAYILYLLAVYTELSVFTCSIRQHVHAEMESAWSSVQGWDWDSIWFLSTCACWVGGWLWIRQHKVDFLFLVRVQVKFYYWDVHFPLNSSSSTQNLCAKIHNLLAHLHDYIWLDQYSACNQCLHKLHFLGTIQNIMYQHTKQSMQSNFAKS